MIENTHSATPPAGDRLSELEEQELVARCINGDEDAFSEVVTRYRDYVFNFALKLMRDPDDAEDLAQDVFLTCFRHFGKFRGDCRLSTWLYTITHNLAKNKWQKDKTHKRAMHVSIDEPVIDSSSSREVTLELPDPAPDPARAAAAREEMGLLEQCIERLSPDQKELIVLRFQEHLSYEEVAAVLGCSVGTVKSRLHRVRKELKILMNELVKMP